MAPGQIKKTNEKKKTAPPSGDSRQFKPEAPKIISNIEWLLRNWRQYWHLILLAIIVIVIAANFEPIIGWLKDYWAPRTVQEWWEQG